MLSSGIFSLFEAGFQEVSNLDLQNIIPKYIKLKHKYVHIILNFFFRGYFLAISRINN
jgi:hypothetical protein